MLRRGERDDEARGPLDAGLLDGVQARARGGRVDQEGVAAVRDVERRVRVEALVQGLRRADPSDGDGGGPVQGGVVGDAEAGVRVRDDLLGERARVRVSAAVDDPGNAIAERERCRVDVGAAGDYGAGELAADDLGRRQGDGSVFPLARVSALDSLCRGFMYIYSR